MTEVKDTAARFVTAFNAHDATAYAKRWSKGFPDGKMTVRNEIVRAPWIVQEVTTRRPGRE